MTGTAARLDLPGLARWAAEESALFASQGSPFLAAVSSGAPRLVLVVGENASGKSLLCRMVCLLARNKGALVVPISLRERTAPGIARALMFGDENYSSTGAISAQVVQDAFKNLDRPQGSVLALDEPELGLSDGYARALGEYIGTEAKGVPKACSGVIVVTHSRGLARGLVAAYGATPTFVAVGTAPARFEDWLDAPEHRSVADLLALPETGLERLRSAAAIMGQ